MNSKLRGYIATKGISQEKISEILGITSVALWRKLTGKNQFKLNEIKLLLSHFSCTFEELF